MNSQAETRCQAWSETAPLVYLFKAGMLADGLQILHHHHYRYRHQLSKIPLKSRYFRSENSIFWLFSYILALFGLSYGLFGPFLTLFNTKKILFSLLGENFSVEA